MIRSLVAALVLLSPLPAQAATCLFVVNGLTVIDGPCDFEPRGSDGSFQVRSPDGGYFAQVHIDRPGVARGYWNEVRWAGHAHSNLGVLLREDACWSSGYATVCAW
jgi:hypothetical protein